MGVVREKWILPGFILNVLLIIFIGVLLNLKQSAINDVRRLEKNSKDFSNNIQDFLNAANRIGNRTYGYVYTGHGGFLLAINEGYLKVAATRLKENSINKAKQENNLKNLFALSDSLLQISVWFIERAKTNIDEATLAIVGERHVKVIDELSDVTHQLELKESQLYAEAIESDEKKISLFTILQWVSLALVVVALFIVYLMIRYYLTSRKEAEKKLATSKVLLQSIVDNTSTPVSVKTISGDYLLVNKQFEQLFNTSDVVGKNDEQLFPYDDLAKERSSDIAVIKSLREIKYEENFNRNGKVLTYWFVKFPIKDTAGNVVGVGTIGSDITEQKMEDEELKEKEAQLKTIIDNGPDAVVVIDEEGNILKWNPKAQELFHYTEQEAIGKPMHELIMSQDFWEKHMGGIHRFLNTGEGPMLNKTVEVAAHTKENKPLEIELTVSTTKTNNRFIFIAFIREIAQRKRQQKEILESKNFVDSIIENIPDMIFVKDAQELRFVRFNKAGEKLLGYSRNELIGKNDYDFFPKEQADFFHAKDMEVLEKGVMVEVEEEEIDTKNGKRLLHTRKIPIADEKGKPLYLVGISYDITEKRRLERERIKMEKMLKENEQRIRLILENIGEGVIVADSSEHVVLSNQMAEEIFETSEITTSDWSNYYNIYYPDGKRVFPSQNLPLERGLKGEESDMEILVEHPETRNKKLLHVSGRPIVGEDDKIIAAVSTIRDVTSYRNLEKALEESEIKYRRLIGFGREVAKEMEEKKTDVQEETLTESEKLEKEIREREKQKARKEKLEQQKREEKASEEQKENKKINTEENEKVNKEKNEKTNEEENEKVTEEESTKKDLFKVDEDRNINNKKHDDHVFSITPPVDDNEDDDE